VDAGPRRLGRGGVPILQHLRALGPAQQRQLGEAPLRVGGHRLQQDRQVPAMRPTVAASNSARR
jgi:hypothetical protein